MGMIIIVMCFDKHDFLGRRVFSGLSIRIGGETQLPKDKPF
jgi:hypothetical protein